MKNTNRSNLEVADVFASYDHLLSGLPTEAYKVIRDLKNCRTERLGKHLRSCDQCEWSEFSYNSCRNRHCPKCQFAKTAKWVEKRVQELLPCSYYHVVFTLPAVLRPLILRNKKQIYDLLFKASSETLREVALRRKNMGANLGFIGVLHTWGQNLIDHPHIHYIVPSGGLSPDKRKWIASKPKYLLPEKILSIVFQGKFLSYLDDLYKKGELKLTGQVCSLQDPHQFKGLLCQSASKRWRIYLKKPLTGPMQIIRYLGHYTHRIAISNRRLIKMENGKIHFKYRDSADGNKTKVMVLEAKEFMRRFLLHVLPKRFVRIRHYGILANRSKVKNLELCLRLLHAATTVLKRISKSVPELIKQFIGIDITICPSCKVGTVQLAAAVYPNTT